MLSCKVQAFVTWSGINLAWSIVRTIAPYAGETAHGRGGGVMMGHLRTRLCGSTSTESSIPYSVVNKSSPSIPHDGSRKQTTQPTLKPDGHHEHYCRCRTRRRKSRPGDNDNADEFLLHVQDKVHDPVRVRSRCRCLQHRVVLSGTSSAILRASCSHINSERSDHGSSP